MCQSVKDTGVCVLNFPSANVYDRYSYTIDNNQWEADEITASGLTIEPATAVNALRIMVGEISRGLLCRPCIH